MIDHPSFRGGIIRTLEVHDHAFAASAPQPSKTALAEAFAPDNP
jgi:hypothetical protein